MTDDGRIPTLNVLINKMTPVEQHIHFEENTGYNIGPDMARIDISLC